MEYLLWRHELADGEVTTVYVVRYPRRTTRARVVYFARPEHLDVWCRRNGVDEAIVGGFFVREPYRPLGELWIGGRPLRHEPVAAPYAARRGSVVIDDGDVRLVERAEAPARPPGDLVQAGPLLVAEGRIVFDAAADREGFSAGAGQFDSDITDGRYPRAALGVSAESVFAIACDGRRSNVDGGLSMVELAEVMVELGAVSAINLDGGGSTTLVRVPEGRDRAGIRASGRVTEDRRDRPLARDVVAADGEHVAAVQPDPSRDLVDHAVVGGVTASSNVTAPHSSSTEPGTLSSMSTSAVSTSPNVAARATSAMSAEARRCDARIAYVSCVARSCSAYRLSSTRRALVLGGQRLRIAGHARREQVRVAVDRAVDRVDRLGGGEDQREVEAVQQRPQRLVDAPRVLAHARLLSLRALDAAAGCAVPDRRLPD